MNATLRERFEAKVSVEPNTGCWIWMGSIGTHGYGEIGVGRKADRSNRTEVAHRVSYQLHKGEIGAGLTIDHLCRNRWCVNPAHLEAVTHRENNLRGTSPPAENARKISCDRGHPFDAVNTIPRHDRVSGRRCRICRDMDNAARYQRGL